jgi:hypothetical protein
VVTISGYYANEGEFYYMHDEDLNNLLECSRLKELTILNGVDLSMRSIVLLGQLAELKALTLDSLGCDSFTTLAPLRQLNALRLSDCRMTSLKPDWASPF